MTQSNKTVEFGIFGCIHDCCDKIVSRLSQSSASDTIYIYSKTGLYLGDKTGKAITDKTYKAIYAVNGDHGIEYHPNQTAIVRKDSVAVYVIAEDMDQKDIDLIWATTQKKNDPMAVILNCCGIPIPDIMKQSIMH